MINEPKTLHEAIQYFSDADRCLQYLAAKRWPDSVVICPTCGSKSVGFLSNQRRWQCSNRHPKRQFSIKVGTVLEDSPLPLEKWLPVIWLISNCKNGISSWEIHRDLGVTQKTAWFMLHRVRLGLQSAQGGKLSGNVEVDETFIGGKSRNMHKARREKVIRGTGGKDKAVVVGMVERGGDVRAFVMPSRRKHHVEPQIRQHIEAGSAIFTDELPSYNDLNTDYHHSVINHAVEYANGEVHTNTMENFWSLLKRGLHGTYISVEPFHLFRYIDEQAFRYNNRKATDAERFDLVVRQIVGRRLTYKELTGKVGETRN